MNQAEPLNRIMGLDYGDVRIGIALSDPLCIFAQPWGMASNTERGLEEIVTLVRSEKVTTIVVGMPLTLKGEEGSTSEKVRAFMRSLEGLTNAAIVAWDERFTTSMAQQALRDIEQKKKNRSAKSGRLDAMAAAVLLQSFLDSTKHSRAC